MSGGIIGNYISGGWSKVIEQLPGDVVRSLVYGGIVGAVCYFGFRAYRHSK